LNNKKTLTSRGLAVEILEKVETKNAFSNLLLNQKIQKKNLQKKDINILTELVYGVMQRKKALDFQLQPFLKKQKKLDNWVIQLLRISLYQIKYLDRIPDYAVINEAVNYAKKRGHKGISGLVNGVLRNILRSELKSFDTIDSFLERIATQYSLPEWLVEKWIADYGKEETLKISQSLNERAKVSLRVNHHLISKENAMAQLRDEGFNIRESQVSSIGLISESGLPASSELFEEGKITIQDETSMLVAPAMQIEPHHKVLDACAAPGGKTTHIASYLNENLGGKVIALDIHQHKVKLIEENAERQKVSEKLNARQMDAKDSFNQLGKEKFDRVLVDAPCSGLGLLRRKPDIRYTKTPEDVERLTKVQMEILDSTAKTVKSGGQLVYSTCTILRDENDFVIQKFLKKNPEFKAKQVYVENEELINKDSPFITILPHEFQSDGFFISCLEKK